jgi:hypothetical protein
VTPVNSGANPYRVIRDWAQLTVSNRPWGGSNGVAIDREGRTVWAVDRCSTRARPGCTGSQVNPVHHFDESGKEITSFGGGMFAWPHGIHGDRDGNVWVAGSRASSSGNAVAKFSPNQADATTFHFWNPRPEDLRVRVGFASFHAALRDLELVPRIYLPSCQRAGVDVTFTREGKASTRMIEIRKPQESVGPVGRGGKLAA